MVMKADMPLKILRQRGRFLLISCEIHNRSVITEEKEYKTNERERETHLSLYLIPVIALRRYGKEYS